MFWKFDLNAYMHYCYLMNENQCQSSDDYLCTGPDCESGNLGGMIGKPTCDDGTEPGPPPETVDCSFSQNCHPFPNDAEIICSKLAPETECECQMGGAVCGDLALTGVTAATMNAAKCMQLCQAVTTCMFWKVDERNKFQKHCHLMNRGQCQAADKDTCEDPDCGSGNLGGFVDRPSCEDRTDGEPPTCPGPIATYPDDETKFYQKWKCFILSEETSRNILSIDMYEPDAAMPEGGYCKLATDGDGRSIWRITHFTLILNLFIQLQEDRHRIPI